jgi:hypothetical protein
LQDIYGKDEFPTTSIVLDILKFSSKRTWIYVKVSPSQATEN